MSFFFIYYPFTWVFSGKINNGVYDPRLPDFLAWSSPGAPHRGGGLPIDEPGLDIDALDRGRD